jgi:UDP-N-acetylmuramate dehydrogenase
MVKGLVYTYLLIFSVSMKIQENISLAQFTTFNIGGPARYFCTVNSDEDLVKAITFAKEKKLKFFILGGGSNILISDSGFNGLVIKNEYSGIEINDTIIKAGAGELWDEFVEKTVSLGLNGVENLSAIPGSVGAAPVQNIGAYGEEVARAVQLVRVFDVKKMMFLELSKKECKFSYRDSIFKQKKGRYIITHVTFKLERGGRLIADYRDVHDYFEKKGVINPTLEEVRQAVINIRWGKLPDWKLWGTGGSFFKNPVITLKKYERLKKQYPELPGFLQSDKKKVKVSLGWILDKVCNAKGLTIGHAGTYAKQALVLVAKPGATAKEVVDLSHELMKRVKDKTGIDIEAEVEWVN